MRIGIFGGAFDPVHFGHLLLAEQAREQGELAEVWFIPTPHPPHKSHHTLTSFDRRVEMLKLALAGQPAFRVDTLENDRPGTSYTADTLAELALRHPGSEWSLILGADALHDLPQWHEPRRIVDSAQLLVAGRPGSERLRAEDLDRSIGLEPGKVQLRYIEMPLVEISSRDLRSRAAAGRSLRYLVPRAVEVFIQEKKLYQRV